MKEVILCKYGELILKGLNRGTFESALIADLRRHVAAAGNFDVHAAQSTAYVEPLDDEADLDEAFRLAKKVFGFISISRAAVCEKSMPAILDAAKQYFPEFVTSAATFRAEAKRSDKRFPVKSPEIAAEIGGAVLDAVPGIRVDLEHPDITLKVEIRESAAYLCACTEKGAGGVPAGSSGRSMLLLSGGIDSPVAAYMMSKRGAWIEAVYFESPPYTSERARQKVLDLAAVVAGYQGRMKVNVISLTHLQEAIVHNCDEEYFTLLLRRFMMRIATRLAHDTECGSVVTGESLGQVASQTMSALAVTDCECDMPVFRPLIGMDKEEIIVIARAIGTFDLSILPYEDCCTVFTPKHPKTRPDLAKVIAQEAKLDCRALEDEAYLTLQSFRVGAR